MPQDDLGLVVNDIVSLTKSGTGAPGTVDTYTFTLRNGKTFSFQVTNGANGSTGGVEKHEFTTVSDFTDWYLTIDLSMLISVAFFDADYNSMLCYIDNAGSGTKLYKTLPNGNMQELVALSSGEKIVAFLKTDESQAFVPETRTIAGIGLGSDIPTNAIFDKTNIKGRYATLSALQTANPNHGYCYLVVADGNWYYWNATGGVWTSGGQYIADGGIDSYFNVDSENPLKNKVVTGMLATSVSLIDKDNVKTGYYLDNNGVEQEINNTRAYSDYIPVIPNQKYVAFHPWNLNCACLYDEDKTFLGVVDPTNVSGNGLYKELTAITGSLGYQSLNWYSFKIAQGNVRYIRFNIDTTEELRFMACKSDTDTAPSAYAYPEYKFENEFIEKGLNDYLLKNTDDEPNEESEKPIASKFVGKNLWPQIYNIENKSTNTVGWYLASGGTPTEINQSRAYTDYIEIELDKAYMAYHPWSLICGVVYDENHNRLFDIDPATEHLNGQYKDLIAVTGSLGYTTLGWYSVKIVHPNAKYIRLNVDNSNDLRKMFIVDDGEHTVPTVYVGYGEHVFTNAIFKEGVQNAAAENTETLIKTKFVKEDAYHNVFVGTTTFSGTIASGTISYNVALGDLALAKLTYTTGDDARYNTAIGSYAMKETTTGNHNTAVGFQCMAANTTGNYNTALGEDALLSNTTASNNVAIGCRAMQNFTTGDYNIAIGVSAMYDANKTPTGSHNIAIGSSAYSGVNQGSYNIVIGDYSYTGQNYQHSIVIGSGVHNTKNNQILIGSGGSTSIALVISGRILELQFNADGTVTWTEIS